MTLQYFAVICLYLTFSLSSAATEVKSCRELLSALRSSLTEHIVIEGNLSCDSSPTWPSAIKLQRNVNITADVSGTSTLEFPKGFRIIVSEQNVLRIRGLILFLSNIEVALAMEFLEVSDGGHTFFENTAFAFNQCFSSGNSTSQRVVKLTHATIQDSNGESTVSICHSFYVCHEDGRVPNFVIDSFHEENCCPRCLNPSQASANSESGSSDDSINKKAIAAVSVLSFMVLVFIVTITLLLQKNQIATCRHTETTLEDRNILLAREYSNEKVEASDQEKLESRESRLNSTEHPEVQSRTISNWNFRLSDVEIREPLGKGSFGKVYKGYWQGSEVAVKCIVHGKNFLETRNEPFEAYLSRHVSHPNVVQTFIIHTVPRGGNKTISIADSADSSFSEMAPKEAYNRNMFMSTDDVFGSMAKGAAAHEEETLETWIVLEFCDRGCLANSIKDGAFKTVKHGEAAANINHALLTALDVANALMYLHNVRIVHGDLKAENVLLKSDVADPRGFVCKVSDFGLSRFLAEDTHIETFTYGTITHMPPELLKGGILTPAADVYSFAVLMWELLTGVRPFEGKTHGEIVLLVVNKEKRPNIPDYCPDGYAELLEDCWRQSHLERPGFPEVVDRLKELLEELEIDEANQVGASTSEFVVEIPQILQEIVPEDDQENEDQYQLTNVRYSGEIQTIQEGDGLNSRDHDLWSNSV